MCFFYADMTCLYFVLLLFISSVRLAFAPSSHLSLSRSLSFRLHLSSSFSLSLSFSLCPVRVHTHCIAVSVFVIRWVFWGSYTKDQRELRSHCFQQRCCIARHTEENHKGFWKWCFTCDKIIWKRLLLLHCTWGASDWWVQFSEIKCTILPWFQIYPDFSTPAKHDLHITLLHCMSTSTAKLNIFKINLMIWWTTNSNLS